MDYGAFINGQWEETDDEMIVSSNPATDEVLWQGSASGKIDVQKAIDAARGAFGHWSRLEIEERKNHLLSFVEELEAGKGEFAKAISMEMGKPFWESLSEVGAMISKTKISFAAYDNRCGQVNQEMGGAQSFTRFKPHGVMAVFGPFNLPGHLPNGHIVPALLAGNTIVFKPSELTPLVATMMINLWKKSGLPDGVINCVIGAFEPK